MNRIAKFFFILISCVAAMHFEAMSQPEYPYSRQGDNYYEEGRYPEAETSYRKSLERNNKASTSYNLANSMFMQNRIPEAISEYQKTIASSDNPDVRSRAFYNMGNAYFQNNEFEQSIQAYKESLKINPTDEDAKKNLMLALRQLKQQQQENKQDQQQEQQQQEQQDQQQQDQQEQQQQDQQQQEQKKEDVSKDEANEILKAIEREDQRVQEKLKKTKGKSTPPVKDW